MNIKTGELRLGNWFIGYDNTPFQWSTEHFSIIGRDMDKVEIDEIIKSGVLLTEDIMKRFKRIEDDGNKRLEFRCNPPHGRILENQYWSSWIDGNTCDYKLHLEPSYRKEFMGEGLIKNKLPDFWYCWYYSCGEWFLPIQRIRQLKYVHQLQNLFFVLTGNELDY